jgi:DNA-binding CsgD family transcriptional regulator
VGRLSPESDKNVSRKSVILNQKTIGADLRVACSLTHAEWRAVQGLAKGKRAADIAAAQGISVHTIRTHLKRAMAKVGVHSQIALVARVFLGLR